MFFLLKLKWNEKQPPMCSVRPTFGQRGSGLCMRPFAWHAGDSCFLRNDNSIAPPPCFVASSLLCAGTHTKKEMLEMNMEICNGKRGDLNEMEKQNVFGGRGIIWELKTWGWEGDGTEICNN